MIPEINSVQPNPRKALCDDIRFLYKNRYEPHFTMLKVEFEKLRGQTAGLASSIAPKKRVESNIDWIIRAMDTFIEIGKGRKTYVKTQDLAYLEKLPDVLMSQTDVALPYFFHTGSAAGFKSEYQPVLQYIAEIKTEQNEAVEKLTAFFRKNGPSLADFAEHDNDEIMGAGKTIVQLFQKLGDNKQTLEDFIKDQNFANYSVVDASLQKIVSKRSSVPDPLGLKGELRYLESGISVHSPFHNRRIEKIIRDYNEIHSALVKYKQSMQSERTP